MSKVWKAVVAAMFVLSLTLVGCEPKNEAPADATENAGGMEDIKTQ